MGTLHFGSWHLQFHGRNQWLPFWLAGCRSAGLLHFPFSSTQGLPGPQGNVGLPGPPGPSGLAVGNYAWEWWKKECITFQIPCSLHLICLCLFSGSTGAPRVTRTSGKLACSLLSLSPVCSALGTHTSLFSELRFDLHPHSSCFLSVSSGWAWEARCIGERWSARKRRGNWTARENGTACNLRLFFKRWFCLGMEMAARLVLHALVSPAKPKAGYKKTLILWLSGFQVFPQCMQTRRKKSLPASCNQVMSPVIFVWIPIHPQNRETQCLQSWCRLCILIGAWQCGFSLDPRHRDVCLKMKQSGHISQ